MATKNNPGKFDCYANAEPDEPMFVLLGRDKDAPALVRAWADRREKDGESSETVAEARACAEAMAGYRAGRLRAYCNGYDVVAARSEAEAREVLRAAGVDYDEEDLDGDGWRILPENQSLFDEDRKPDGTVGEILHDRAAGKPAYLWSVHQ